MVQFPFYKVSTILQNRQNGSSLQVNQYVNPKQFLTFSLPCRKDRTPGRRASAMAIPARKSPQPPFFKGGQDMVPPFSKGEQRLFTPFCKGQQELLPSFCEGQQEFFPL
jgi:hypothetical protein